MGATDNTDQLTVPRSMRHQNILDIAAERPDASIDAIAREVPSATPDLVENVLEEHGDPAAEASITPSEEEIAAEEAGALPEENPTEDSANPPTEDSDDKTVNDLPEDLTENTVDERSGEAAVPEESKTPSDEVTVGDDPASTQSEDPSAMTADQDSFDASELTAKQREVFRIISEQPDLTQAEIGDRLGVSAPTVSNRVNTIDGFEWANREEFANKTLNDLALEPMGENTEMSQHDTELKTTVTQLTERLETVEDKLEQSPDKESLPADGDPELKHKVLHACLQADSISEEDELRVIKKLEYW